MDLIFQLTTHLFCGLCCLVTLVNVFEVMPIGFDGRDTKGPKSDATSSPAVLAELSTAGPPSTSSAPSASTPSSTAGPAPSPGVSTSQHHRSAVDHLDLSTYLHFHDALKTSPRKFSLFLFLSRTWIVLSFFLVPLGCSLPGWVLTHNLSCTFALLVGVFYVFTLTVWYQSFLYDGRRRVVKAVKELRRAVEKGRIPYPVVGGKVASKVRAV